MAATNLHDRSGPSPVALRSAGWLALGLIIAVAIGGCLNVPLGDPEKSTVDPKLVGIWLRRDDSGGEVTILQAQAYDARTYHVIQYGAKPDPAGGWERSGEMIYKGWLTEVAGRTFVTLQVLGHETETPYMVIRLDVIDDSFEARGIKPGFVKDNNVQTPDQLRQLIEANIDNLEMYEEVQKYFKAEAPDSDTVKAVIGLFR